MATTPKRDQDLSWRERREIRPGRYRPKTRRNGAIFIAFCAIFCWILYTKPSLPLLSSSGKEYTADFDRGENIRPGYTPIRVEGVEVGQVTKVERLDSGKGVKVTWEIKKDSGVEIKKDARVALRWRTLLGRNLYVDIDEGSRSAGPYQGTFFPMSRTSTQVELDTVLEPLDNDGREALRTMFEEFDKGFASPKAFQDTVDSIEPAMRPLSRGVRALRGQRPGTDLPELVTNTNRALGVLAREEVALRGVIDHGSVALGATAAHSADLASTLNNAPSTMRETRTTLQRLERTLDILDPLATKLLPGARKLDGAARQTEAALAQATPLLSDLRPTLRDLSPAVRDLGTAARSGAPAFGPLGTTMKRVEDTFIPWLNRSNEENKRPNYQNIGPAVASVSTATSWGDFHGPVANFEAALGPNAFINSPCKFNFGAAEITQLLQCELISRVITARFTGQRPQDVRVKNSAVSLSRLAPYLTGKKPLLTARVKPLRARRSK